MTPCCTFATKQSQSDTKRHIGVRLQLFGGILSRCGSGEFVYGHIRCTSAKNDGIISATKQKKQDDNSQ